MHCIRTLIPGLAILVSPVILTGQDSTGTGSQPPNKSIRVFYQNGRVLQTNDFVRGENLLSAPIDDFQAASIRLAWNTNGQKTWQQLYHFPAYGIGVCPIRFIHTPELGKPIAFYGFFRAPFVYGPKFSFGYDAGFGLTFNWEKFEPGEDKYNIALGAEQSVYIDLGLFAEYKLFQRWTLGAGAGFTHFSNGALKKPNQGINTFSPRVSLACTFGDPAALPETGIIPRHQPDNSLTLSVYTGWKNVLYKGTGVDTATASRGVYYNEIGLSATFNRQVSYKSKLGFGATLGYDGAANSTITVENGKLDDNDAPFREGFELSIHPSYELVINDLSLIIQPGFYIYRFDYQDKTPGFFQRVGLRYRVWKNLSAGLNLRAYKFYISDYIEWNLGYTF